MTFAVHERVFEELWANVWVLKFQKRVLPHAHSISFITSVIKVHIFFRMLSIQLYQPKFVGNQTLFSVKKFPRTTCIIFASISTILQFAERKTFIWSTLQKPSLTIEAMMNLNFMLPTVDGLPITVANPLHRPTAPKKELQPRAQLKTFGLCLTVYHYQPCSSAISILGFAFPELVGLNKFSSMFSRAVIILRSKWCDENDATMRFFIIKTLDTSLHQNLYRVSFRF